MSTVILSGCNIFQSLKNTFVNSKKNQINNSNDNSHYGKENIPSFFFKINNSLEHDFSKYHLSCIK